MNVQVTAQTYTLLLNETILRKPLKTKKPALNERRLSDPTIHYTTKAKRPIVEWADSTLLFWLSSSSRVLAAMSVCSSTSL
jgi:hypothetical protein